MLMFYGLRKQNHIRGVFKTQSNIYEWSFIAKIVNGFKPLAFFRKRSFVVIRLGSKYASAY